jgi:mannose-1-phosphate guanylyltransferase
VEKPAPGTEPSNLINAGTYVLEPSVLARIPAGEKVSIERATFPQVATDGGLYALATDDYWIDTGRPELYLQANLDLLDGRRRHDRCEAVDPLAAVHAGAVVERTVVGRHASVGAATVRGSVLLPGSVVGDNAVVTDSVVMGSIGAGAVVHDSVIGAGGHVAPGEHVSGERRPAPDPT